jgi:hypothetical protein
MEKGVKKTQDELTAKATLDAKVVGVVNLTLELEKLFKLYSYRHVTAEQYVSNTDIVMEQFFDTMKQIQELEHGPTDD